MKHFSCLLPSGVEFGAGKIKELPKQVAGKSVLLLSDRGVQQAGIIDLVSALCAPHASMWHEYLDILPEPAEDDVTGVVNSLVKLEIEAVLAVGGGSVMDMAKLVAVMINGGPSLHEMFAGNLPQSKDVKLIMVPTTAGTGSEATPNAIVFRPAYNLKVGIVCDCFMPDRVILDPELLCGLPAAITASTGMDALCHALECYVSNKANFFSDMLAVEASRLIFNSLKQCVSDGENLTARADMLLASFYAGICIASSGTNIVHALSYPLGGRYRIAHGISNAVLLAPAFAFNKDCCLAKLAAIAHLTGKNVSGMNDDAKADILIEALYDLSRELGIPARLSDLGVPAEDLEDIVDAAFQVKRLLDNNPKPLCQEDIRSIYKSIL